MNRTVGSNKSFLPYFPRVQIDIQLIICKCKFFSGGLNKDRYGYNHLELNSNMRQDHGRVSRFLALYS